MNEHPTKGQGAPEPAVETVAPMPTPPMPPPGPLPPSALDPWRPLLGEAAWVIVSFVAMQLLASVVLLHLLGVTGEDQPEGTPDGMGWVMGGAMVASHLTGWGVLFWRLHLRGLPPRPTLALDGPVWAWRFFGMGVGFQTLGLVTVALFHQPPDTTNALESFMEGSWWAWGFMLVMASLAAPLLEEAMFRGLLFPALRARMGFWPSALFTSLLFAGLHAQQTAAFLPALGVIFGTGWMLAWLRERTGSLWPGIFFHAGYNFLVLALLALGKEIK